MACLFIFIAIAPVWADSKPAQSLDEKLLERLNADLTDEFDRELFAPDANRLKRPDLPGAGENAPGTGGDEWKAQLLRELGAAATPEEQNPLLEIARQMRQVEGLIAQSQSGPKTQDLQNQIVASLEELIKQARSRCKQCSPSQSSPKVAARRQVPQPKKKPGEGRGKPSQKPVTDPVTKPGKAAPGGLTLEQMRELIKSVWGELPETEREQMLEWAGDEFLPKYEWLIELYFKRLAEERRPAGD